MAQITSTTGIISGIDSAAIIEQLIEIESIPKNKISNRNIILESKQTAYQTVNAQLLSLKNASSRISDEKAFEETTASSSNEDVATVSSGTGAQVGNYSFIVKQLVGSQQTITRGFTDSGSTAIDSDGGLLTFNRGESRLDRKTQLSEFNGGDGISRGLIRVTDRSGSTAVVDLTSVVTAQDVVDQINKATGVNVVAAIDGDGFTITDATGQSSSNLVIQDVGTSATATSLGLAGSSGSSELVGTAVNTIGEKTLVSSLNDGNGVRTTQATPDIAITTNGGDTYNINLSDALTLKDLFDRIEESTNGEVTASVNAAGTGIVLTDSTPGNGFEVAALNDSQAAKDLGILGADDDNDDEIGGDRVISEIDSKLLKQLRGGRGLLAFGGEPFAPLDTTTALADLFQGLGLTTATGDDIEIVARDDADTTYSIDIDGLTTVQDLIDEVSTATGGKVELAIDGQSLVLNDLTGGSGNFTVRNASNSSVVSQLGLGIDAGVTSVTGLDVDPAGVSGEDALIDVTNSAGGTTTIDLAGAESLTDVIDLINDAGAGVTAALNAAGTGIALTDTAGGTGDLEIADGTDSVLASQLGLVGVFEEGVADSGALGFQFVNEGSRLDNLGIARGKFTIRDSDGRTGTVDLTQGNEQTIGDVISEINSRGLAIVARVNDTGDGILIEDTGSGAVSIEISEEGSTTARDLGIVGEFAAGQAIDGSFKKTITVDGNDTLDSLALKINNANIGVNAAVINDGSAGAPYRLSLSSETSGTGGAFTLDDGGLGLDINNLAAAKDAVVFYGGDEPQNSIVVTSKSNTLSDLIPGATVSLLSTSDTPIQITISDDPEAITTAVSDFANSFNALISTINEHDSYNAETEERGLLLGDSAVARLRSSIYNALIGANGELTGQYNSLAQIGLSIGSGGRLSLDTDKFQTALQADPDAVRDLFTFEQFEVDPETGEDTDVVAAQGVGVEIDKLLASLTDSTDGILERQVALIQDQINANNNRIESIDQQIESKQQRLEKQFADLELALADMQDQQSSLTALATLAGNTGA